MSGNQKENKKPAHTGVQVLRLLNMTVIADMVFAIAIIAFAAGTVAEFQFGIADIRPAAHGTAVGVGGLGGCFCGLVGTGIKPDDLGLLLGRLFPEEPAGIGTPGHGNHIQNILAEEQEVVGKGNHREQVVGERIGDQVDHHNDQIKQCKDPGLHRNDKEQQEMGIRIQGSIAEEQAQVQIHDAGLTAEDHAVNVHHQHTGEIVQIESQGSPNILHGLSKRIITEQGNGCQKQRIGPISQGVGNKPPDLTMEDRIPVKIQKVIQKIVAGYLTHDIDHGSAQDDVQHQIRHTSGAVFVAEKLKLSAQVFQSSQLLI